MGKEKFIKGKQDSGNHDGRYANVRREQESQVQLAERETEKSDTQQPKKKAEDS